MSANNMALDVTAQANSQGQDPTAVSAAIVMQKHAAEGKGKLMPTVATESSAEKSLNCAASTSVEALKANYQGEVPLAIALRQATSFLDDHYLGKNTDMPAQDEKEGEVKSESSQENIEKKASSEQNTISVDELVESFEGDDEILKDLSKSVVYKGNKHTLGGDSLESLLSAVAAGDIQRLGWAYRLYAMQQSSTLSVDTLKSLRHEVIFMIGLASRQARLAGVKENRIVALAERLAIATEALTDAERIRHMRYIAARAFTDLVSALQGKREPTKTRLSLASANAAVKEKNAATSNGNANGIAASTDNADGIAATTGNTDGITASDGNADGKTVAAEFHNEMNISHGAEDDSAATEGDSAALGDGAGAVAYSNTSADDSDSLNSATLSGDDLLSGSSASHSAAVQLDASDSAAPLPKMIEKALQYLDKHIYEDIFVANIAKDVGCSGEHLSRLFKKHCNITLMEYVTKERISIAKDMLMHSNCKVREIALVLRFSSVAHFCNVFREIDGLTPSEWREANCKQ
ncbi:helix-turn-helix transcriptional regulator [Anaerobiospirillum succiniciproducens]|uniref:helix-turn-helix transcriptional regulator n=1 Tax=Anaerobiospirillum succiniciproducens TaxID=13335 RepID=UPI00040C6E38|nr:AraC family transcriptional regulator [Anaerobiospirillum succiniciproducens]